MRFQDRCVQNQVKPAFLFKKSIGFLQEFAPESVFTFETVFLFKRSQQTETMRMGYMKDHWLRGAICGVLGLVAVLSAGCTSIPERQFHLYRQAFAETRAQSELVLADHAAARQVKSNLAAQVRLRTNPAPAGRLLSERLEIANVDASGAGVPNDIEVRLKAWNVISAYNDALSAVAAGAKSADVEDSVNGFVSALKNFPVSEVADLAGRGVPYVGAALKVLELVQKEVEARRFRNAVLQSEEPMNEFVALLRKDAVLLRNYRVALLDERFAEQEIMIFDHADRFRAVATAHGWNPPAEVNGLIKQINANRALAAGIETFPAIANAAAAPTAPSDQDSQLVELRTLAEAIEREATEARATVAELAAYHELMRRYLLLIDEFERTLGALSGAAKRNAHQLPSIDQLQQIISSVRLAQQIYRETK